MNIPFHVINEYEILKKVLSNLSYKELLVASEVCQYWKSVADIVIQKNAEISCIIKKDEEWPDLNDKILPKLIIYSNDSDKSGDILKLSNVQFPAVNQCMETHFHNPEEAIFIYLANWKFINTVREGGNLTICHSCNEEKPGKTQSFRESLLMIPESNNLKVDIGFIDLVIWNPQRDKEMSLDKIKSAKCSLFLTSAHDRKGVKIIKSLCEDLEQSGHDLTMAGGVSHFMMRKGGGYNAIGGAVITFSGENLTAKTFVVPYEADLNIYFTKISKILGPLESGYLRVAFIFTCVDRFGLHAEGETKEFAQHFPNVPLNGFWSLGEFCMGYTHLKDKRKKASSAHSTSKGSQFFFQQASAYLFITYKK